MMDKVRVKAPKDAFIPDDKTFPSAESQAMQYPVVSPEFALTGLVRAGTGVLNKAAQHFAPKLATTVPKTAQNAGKQITGGLSFTKGSIVGDVGAQAAIEGADEAMGANFQQEHPTAAGAVRLGAGLLVGIGAGYAAEKRYIDSLRTGATKTAAKNADTFVPDQQSIDVAEALTSKKHVSEMSTDELMQAAGLKPKSAYPKVQDQYRVETPIPPKPYEPNFRMVPNNPPMPYVDKAAKLAEDARVQSLAVAETDANARRAKSAERLMNEVIHGSSEDVLKQTNAQAFKPKPDADAAYKTMTPEQMQEYDAMLKQEQSIQLLPEDIKAGLMHQNGDTFVVKTKDGYEVQRFNGNTHNVADSKYPLTEDGLSIAKARADYVENRALQKEAENLFPEKSFKTPGADKNGIMMMHSGGAFLSDTAEKGMDNIIRSLVKVPAKAAYKTADYLAGGRINQAWETVKDSDVTNIITGHKIYGRGDYMSLRDDLFRSINGNQVNYEKLHRQLLLMDEGTSRDLYRYMSGNRDTALHPSIKTFADEYIDKINQKGQQLVDLGILDPSQFEKFKGRYLHRSYMKTMAEGRAAAFTNKKTIKGVYSRGNTWTGPKAEYDDLLQRGEIGDFFDGKIEAHRMENGQYRFSQDWTPEQRARWGEVEDIAYSLPETLSRMDDMIANGQFLKKVLTDTGYVHDAVDDTMKGAYMQLQGKRYGALNQKWVPRDVAKDIDFYSNAFFGHNPDEAAHKFREGMRTYISLWKSSHTLYNPKAHVNNLMSNVTLQYMEGVNPITAMNNARRGLQASIKVSKLKELDAKRLIGLSDEEKRAIDALMADDDVKLYMQAEAAGLFGRSQLNDILNRYVNNTKESGGVIRSIHRNVGNVYEGEDNVMRFSLLKALVDRGEPFGEAITHVNRTIPDYSKPMSEAAQWLRGSGITPFMSWTYYSIPILMRQMKEHPTRALGIIAAMSAIYEGAGIDAPLPFTTSEDMPKEGFAYKRIPIYTDGKEVTTLKVDKWLPHGELANPVEFLRGFLNFGTWQPAVDVIKNNNAYFNRPITRKDGSKAVYDLGKYTVQNVLPMPDVLDQAFNLVESRVLDQQQRRKDSVVTPRTTTEELLNIMGTNVLTYDKAKQRQKTQREKIKSP
ncbi:hypothetical protein WCX49_11750 [Sulfurimonas sp. HSL-1656]|uniref:hypothetical protein n=1 Tax=Thiomicrolovo subterrani TaxID=3131934 RepID=UPI0031F796E9